MHALVESNEITEIISRPKAIIVDGVQHPKNIFSMWTEAELKAIGIYPIAIDSTNFSNTAYYTNTSITYTYNSEADTVTGTYGTATPQDLAELKAWEVESTNIYAANLLEKYDWYTLRAARGGAAIPSAVATYQAAVTTKANEHEAAINAVSTLSALAALEVEWPSEPS